MTEEIKFKFGDKVKFRINEDPEIFREGVIISDPYAPEGYVDIAYPHDIGHSIATVDRRDLILLTEVQGLKLEGLKFEKNLHENKLDDDDLYYLKSDEAVAIEDTARANERKIIKEGLEKNENYRLSRGRIYLILTKEQWEDFWKKFGEKDG